MDLQLSKSVVLVTGSSAGIGRATAIAFGKEGARVAVTYHKNRSAAEGTAAGVRSAGGEAIVLQYDLAEPDSIRQAIAGIEQQWGSLNVLVNTAAPMDIIAPQRNLFEEVPLETWQAMLRSSLEGLTTTIQSALPLMRKSGWGRIINMSSDAVDGWPGMGPYATAKAGLAGLTRTLAAELGPANILTNVVMPGAVMTDSNLARIPAEQREQIRQYLPTRRLITPEDVAAVIVFLGSPVNTEISGETVRVTGGRH